MTLVFKNKGCLYSNDQQQHRALLAQSVDRRRLRAVHDKNALAFRRLTLHALARAVSSGLLLRVFCGLCEDRRLRMQGTRLTSAGSSIFAQSTGTACGQCSSRCSGPAVHIPVAQVFMRYAGSSSRVCALAMHARARGWFAAPCLARMPGQDSCSSCQHESRRREQRDSAPRVLLAGLRTGNARSSARLVRGTVSGADAGARLVFLVPAREPPPRAT